MKNLYDGLQNLYPVSKTLRFELKPIGKTQEHMELNRVLDMDNARAENVIRAKQLMDEVHRFYITQQITCFELPLDKLEDYYVLYSTVDKGKEIREQMMTIESFLRKQISKQLQSSDIFKKLFGKEMFDNLLKEYILNKDYENESERIKDLAVIESFHKFTTYFIGYFKTRETIYSHEEKATSLAYRTINDNLGFFLKNMRTYEKHKEKFDSFAVEYLPERTVLSDIFSLQYFNSVLTQKGIMTYNCILGGLKNEDETQVKGLNNLINEYNQIVDQSKRIPQMNMLYNQILATSETMSFQINSIENDQDLVNNITLLHQLIEKYCFSDGEEKITAILNDIQKMDCSKMYINAKNLNQFSVHIFHNWRVLIEAIEKNYDSEHLGKKGPNAAYLKKRNTYLKNVTDYSILDLMQFVKEHSSYSEEMIYQYFESLSSEKNYVNNILMAYQKIEKLLSTNFENEKNLMKDAKAIENIKEYLDSVKEYQEFVYSLMPTDPSLELDMNFYSVLFELKQILEVVVPIYNKVRNYLTQKPYSSNKIKLNFDNPTLMSGWDLNKENSNSGLLLKKDGLYYLGIIKKGEKINFSNVFCDDHEPCYRKMQYKLLPSPNKMLPKVFFSEGRKAEFGVTDELLKKYKQGLHLKGNPNFSPSFCHELIDFFKGAIENHEDWSKFDFKFRNTDEYEDISQFYQEVEYQGYKVRFQEVPVSYIDFLIENDKLYLYQIYNKDFSPKTKGIPNLHTLYFKALFDEKNLENPIYKLNGSAEVFWRKQSLKKSETTIHPAGMPTRNKNLYSENTNHSHFTPNFEIIKNKRYTEDKYFLHIPITMNFRSKKINNINALVNKNIKESDKMHIIGISRGEHNLLSLCVIDLNGKIVWQESLNIIDSTQKYFAKNANGEISNYQSERPTLVNYHALLNEKKQEQNTARKSWQSIGCIKELKSGYIGQVIHRIVELMFQYHAAIVLEDLNLVSEKLKDGLERQVYQSFEKKLIEKLNYLVLKDKCFNTSVDSNTGKRVLDLNCYTNVHGSAFNAYQLTNKFESFQKMGKQNGVLFLVPATNVYKIDPTTGFVNFLYVKYESVEKSKELISKFDKILFNTTENVYEFYVDDYSSFTNGEYGPKKDWIFGSYGERIKFYRDSLKNNQWVSKQINLTDEFKELFKTYDIDETNIKESILSNTEKEFFKELLQIIRSMLQLRNSIPNSSIDYIISPVKDAKGNYFDSRKYQNGDDMTHKAECPVNADMNGAFNIARKGLMMIQQIKATDDEKLSKLKSKDLTVNKEEYLKFIQSEYFNK